MKFRSLSEEEKVKIKELIVANQIYEYLVAGFVGTHEWRKVLDEAHSKYVKPNREAKHKRATPADRKTLEEEKTKKIVVFGSGDFDGFTKSSIIL